MRYLLSIYGDESGWNDVTPEQGAQIMAAYEAFGREAARRARSSAARASSRRRRPPPCASATASACSPTARSRRPASSSAATTCSSARDLDEAIGWAAKIPGAAQGSVEVRPVMDYDAMGAEAPDHDAAARA